ncbi:YciI family protein [Nostoc sp. 'Lobaria pulmonaria (5183) cyanobiont']|uniref:YciI family protein n=1 Tax=Nostoc sp. 'Lobaria pulmonaria (5183) cyanobiont' TaxID=1618022 RepID=UPI001F3A1F9C|nr:YciI family protein [Nostoc sp. 'Lobaria pulmonaria (5183) cyanobiont']
MAECCRFETAPFDLRKKGNKGGNPMKYLLLIYLEENALSQTEREHCYVESAQLAQQLNSKGQYLATAPLHPVATATSVRLRDGKPLVTDGPFAETREQLGGFFLINAQDLDEAIAIAARIPGARVGTVEIRPVIEVAGLPENS